MTTVLVVDDHPVVIEGIRRILATAPDVDVIGEARDGAQAIRLAGVLRPDVISLDLRMPGRSGAELVRRLRDVAPRSALIVLTSYGDQAYVRQAQAAGAIAFVLKSAPPAHLIAAIRGAAPDQVLSRPAVVDGAPEGRDRVQRPLTRRSGALKPVDRQILSYVSNGATGREISVALGLTEATVKRRLTVIYRALGSADRAHAVAQALRRGLI